MKLFIKHSLVSLIFLLLGNLLFGQKHVSWVHGLGGDETSFEQYAIDFGATYSNSTHTRNLYVSDRGINTGANECLQDLRTNGMTSSNGIAIGHSMGGLVLREMDRLGQLSSVDDLFSCYITLATPNQGAAIATSVNNGSLRNYFNGGCKEATDLVNALIPGKGGIFATALPWQGLVCNILYNELENNMDGFANNPSLTDLQPNSTILAQLDNVNSTKPRITMWGNERSPVHWRQIGSIMQSPSQRPVTRPINDDNNLVIKVEKSVNRLKSARTVFNSLGLVNAFNAFWNPTAAAGAVYFYNAARQCRHIVEWEQKSEDGWNVLINSKKVIYKSFYHYNLLPSCQKKVDIIFQKYHNGNRIPDLKKMMAEASKILDDPNCWGMVRTTYPFIVGKKSDGLIANHATKISGVQSIQIDDANHQEMVNHRNLHVQLQQTFDGNNGASFRIR